MLKILLDSDVIIEFLRGNSNIVASFKDFFTKTTILYYSPVSIAEIYAGLLKGEEEITDNFFRILDCLEIDRNIGKKAGEYLKKYTPSHNLEIADALIASTAFQNKIPLWTLNKKHYPMKDIRVLNF